VTTERQHSGKHRVVLGDDLRSLAERYYGDADRWTRLWYANRAVLANRTTLTPGESLIIPAEHLLVPSSGSPGEEPDGIVGPDGLIDAPGPDRDAGDNADRGWSQPPPPRVTSAAASRLPRRPPRSARNPGRPVPATRRRSLGEVLEKVPTPVFSFAIVLLVLGVYALFNPEIRSSLNRPVQVRDLPGVATVDNGENEIRLRRGITRDQARAVLDRAFRLEGEWRMILGPSIVPIVRGGSINQPNDLYPQADLLVRIAADLPDATPQSITIGSDYKIAGTVLTPDQVIGTARALVDVLATDGNGMAIDQLRVTDRSGSRLILVPEHLAVTRTTEIDTTLHAVSRLADFAMIEFGERPRVVVRAPSKSEFVPTCRAAAEVFRELEVTIDLEVMSARGLPRTSPCP
jgi:hypothetical protein